MRTKNAIRNLIVAWGGQIVVLLGTFISRSIFVKVLPAEYLGVNGLFANILSMLSMVDLGIGVSIAYYLYEPLAKRDEKKLSQLMNYYKKMYTTIGGIVFVLGISLTPFLDWFIKEETTIPNLEIIYILAVVNSAITYLGVYKSVLINADQKNYITSFYYNLFRVAQLIVSIIVLVITKDYLVYYSVSIIETIVYNITITYKANQLFPFLAKNKKEKIDNQTKTMIRKNVVAMMCHKIRHIFINFTDNIVISKFISIISVGLYSNYSIILMNLNKVVGQVFSAMTASIGNYNVSESDEKKEKLLYTIYFLDFAVYSFCSVCLFVLFNPFIKLWLGEDYLMSPMIVLILVINNYLQGMRKVVLSFKDACGLFKQDRFNALLEALLNLIISVVLAKYWGIVGVFIGTIASFVITSFWVEPVVLFKYGFKSSLFKYFKIYILYFIETSACVAIAYYISTFIPDGILGLILRLLVCGLVWGLSVLIFHSRSEEFKTLLSKVIKNKGKKKNETV